MAFVPQGGVFQLEVAVGLEALELGQGGEVNQQDVPEVVRREIRRRGLGDGLAAGLSQGAQRSGKHRRTQVRGHVLPDHAVGSGLGVRAVQNARGYQIIGGPARPRAGPTSRHPRGRAA